KASTTLKRTPPTSAYQPGRWPVAQILPEAPPTVAQISVLASAPRRGTWNRPLASTLRPSSRSPGPDGAAVGTYLTDELNFFLVTSLGRSAFRLSSVLPLTARHFSASRSYSTPKVQCPRNVVQPARTFGPGVILPPPASTLIAGLSVPGLSEKVNVL